METPDRTLGRLKTIAIRGDGVAARCCAHLLRNACFEVTVERTVRVRVPAIMLSDAALALIRDVFQAPGLFAGLPRIKSRIVAWGENAEPRALAHSAIVLSEDQLLAGLGCEANEASSTARPDFWIYTSGPLPAPAQQNRFGRRTATAAQVSCAENSSCCIESLHNGWLFLIPNAREATWLLGIGAPLTSLLSTSHLIAPLVRDVQPIAGEFPVCPRISHPLCGASWLACGTAALAFDPICGDGTAHAIREAILASAVIRAITNGEPPEALFAHYESRLIAGLQRHLALSADFYRTGGSTPWWQSELDSLAEGFRWCAARLAVSPEPHYQLRGFELVARSSTIV